MLVADTLTGAPQTALGQEARRTHAREAPPTHLLGVFVHRDQAMPSLCPVPLPCRADVTARAVKRRAAAGERGEYA